MKWSYQYLGKKKGWKQWVPIQHCELNYCTNMSRQILKAMKEKDQVSSSRNIGFGFIYFNDVQEKMLKKLFSKKFKQITKMQP